MVENKFSRFFIVVIILLPGCHAGTVVYEELVCDSRRESLCTWVETWKNVPSCVIL